MSEGAKGFTLRLVAGPVATIACVIALAILARQGWEIPNPPALLGIAVVYSAFEGGVAAGLVSAAIAFGYIAYFFSLPGPGLQFSSTDFARVLVWAIALPAVACLVGFLQRRAQRVTQVQDANEALRRLVDDKARVEEELRRHEEQLRLLCENIPGMLAYYDADWRCRYCNSAMARFYGRSAAESVGMNIRDLVDASAMEEVEPHLRPLLEGKAVRYSRPDARAGSGAGGWIEVSLVPQLDSTGRVIGVYDLTIDVTDRRAAEAKLRESNERLDLALNASGLTLFDVDTEQNTIYLSKEWSAMLGGASVATTTTMEELIGLVHPEDRKRVWNEILKALKGEHDHYQNEHRVRTFSGDWIWIESRGRVVERSGEGKALRLVGTNVNISGRREAERLIRESEGELRLLVDNVPAMICRFDRERRYTFANRRYASFFGLTAEEIVGKHVRDVLGPAAYRDVDAHLGQAPSGKAVHYERLVERRDGSTREIDVNMIPDMDLDGTLRGYYGLVLDTTERKRAQEALATNALQQRIVAEFGQVALTVKSFDELAKAAVHSVTRGLAADYAKVLKYLADEKELLVCAAIGWDLSAMGRTTIGIEGDSHAGYCIARNEPVVVEDFTREKRFVLSRLSRASPIASGIAVTIPGGATPYGAITVHATHPRKYSNDDVNFVQSIANVVAAAIARWETDQRYAHLAQFDPLTALPNRNLFRDRLTRAIARADREGRMTALVFLDLDRFKEVNDTFGHQAGDQVLKEVAKRLSQSLREGDTIARLGGDEFIVILEDLREESQADVAAAKILSLFTRPMIVEGSEFFITPSVGIAVHPIDGGDAQTLLKHADIAMYHAKGEGRNNFQRYSATMSTAAGQRLILESSLRKAIERREFTILYQPVVDMRTFAIRGGEALLRWRQPDVGLVTPQSFIGVAEQTGLIVPIGEWVLDDVCRQLRAWKDAGREARGVAVNLSARQLRNSNVASLIEDALKRHGVDPGLLGVEITESLLMDNPDASNRTLQKLKEMGIHVALDDFGIGYSSLSYLKHFPIDVLKIDQSFVRDVPSDADDCAMVRAMIGLAHSLGMTATAEGVETEEQLRFLRDEGCDAAQGYLFSRPVAAAEFAAFKTPAPLQLAKGSVVS